MTSLHTILQRAQERFPDMVAWRRHLHRNPELSFMETRTSAFVLERLAAWGIPATQPPGMCGIVGRIEGAKPGKTIALRADMDALPIQDGKSCEYASQVPGVMHACGHDAHTAALLATASIIQEHQDQLAGTVLLIFQHAEETTPGGAQALLGTGLLDETDEVYGIHLWTPLSTGIVGSTRGPMMAAADEFRIAIHGKGGHAGLPHATADSLVAAAHLIVNLQTIVSRSVDPIQPCVVSVGSVQGGYAFNVIAEQCDLMGTVRSFDDHVRELALDKVGRLARQTCEMFGAEASVEIRRGYPAVVNHPPQAERALKLAAASSSVHATAMLEPVMAGEDFAYYLQRFPGCFLFVGCGNPDKGAVHPHHHPLFDIDEDAMLIAAELFLRLAFAADAPTQS